MVGGRCAVRHPSEQRQKPLGTARGHRRTHDGMHARRPARARARQSSEPAGGHDSALRPRTPALRTSRPRTAPLCHRSALCPAEQCWCGGRAVLVWRRSSAGVHAEQCSGFFSSAEDFFEQCWREWPSSAARPGRTAPEQCGPIGPQCYLRGLLCPSGLAARNFLPMQNHTPSREARDDINAAAPLASSGLRCAGHMPRASVARLRNHGASACTQACRRALCALCAS